MGVVVVMVVTDLQRDTRTHTRTTHRRAAADEGVFAVVAVCGLRVIEDFTPAARTCGGVWVFPVCCAKKHSAVSDDANLRGAGRHLLSS